MIRVAFFRHATFGGVSGKKAIRRRVNQHSRERWRLRERCGKESHWRPRFAWDCSIHGNYNNPVYAAASGVVVRSGTSLGYGWIVVIYHGKKEGQDLFTWYGHSYENQIMCMKAMK
ncbi:M23 family metallopeptidase [Polycladomyces subterraneus]|uniref:M23 family metallopeptidase n=1 Tax=Polycladomyces subterraneus TaxID=1016997 RepID=A0ABT8INS3_9BACL|nr:M23 family metallopeptidase [Polycladomyces subterraneus]MDN4594385.1 M23 family metallopeptidase [Polycladomyces subterraneus]